MKDNTKLLADLAFFLRKIKGYLPADLRKVAEHLAERADKEK